MVLKSPKFITLTHIEYHFRTLTTWHRRDCFTLSSWGLQVSYDTIQCLITRLQFDIIAVKVNYLGKVKSTKNSKILNLLINGFYHSNKSSADFQSNYKSNSNSKMSKSKKLVRNSPKCVNTNKWSIARIVIRFMTLICCGKIYW